MSEEMSRTEAIEVLKDIVSKPMLYSNHIIGACKVALASLETDEAYQLEFERTTTPQEPKTGHWIMTSDYLTTAYGSIDYVKCSCCGKDSLEEGDYCPNCGADMREVKE